MLALVKATVAFSLAAANREENTAMLQNELTDDKMLQAGAGTIANRLALMEQHVMAFAKSGVPEDAKPFLDNIKSILETDIMNSIRNERSLHSQDHSNKLAAFTSASDTYTQTKAGIETTEAPAASGKKDGHGQCRTQEGVDYQEKTTCDGEQLTAQNEYNAAENEVNNKRGASAHTCVDSDYDWRNGATFDGSALPQYANAINAWVQKRSTLNDKIDECNGLTDDLQDQKDKCDGAQTEYEQAGCTESLAWQAAKGAYEEAYENAKTAFEDSFGVWTEQSSDREFQCKMVKTLVCYINALHANDDQADLTNAVTACDQGRAAHDCADVTFAHDDTPAALTPETVPAAPCSPNFDYGPFPEGTAQGTCTACAGIV